MRKGLWYNENIYEVVRKYMVNTSTTWKCNISVNSTLTMTFTLWLAYRSYTTTIFPFSTGFPSNILSNALGLIDLSVDLNFFCWISLFIFVDAHNSLDLEYSHFLLIYSTIHHLSTCPTLTFTPQLIKLPFSRTLTWSTWTHWTVT